MLLIFDVFTILFFKINLLVANAVINSDRHDFDAYGICIASTNYFVVLAQNDAQRYIVSMAPFGISFVYNYTYETSNDFVISIAVGRRQNLSQLSFVYLSTSTTDGQYQKLGLFTFSRENRMISVKVWKRKPSELSTLQVDLFEKYTYGFLSNNIFAFMILKKTLPAVYLVRLNPPNTMTLVDNYTLYSDTHKFTNLTLINTLDHPVRSTSWLDDAGLLLSDTTTLPWTKSRTQAINVSSNDIITPPTFIRLTRTYDYQLVVLTTDGVVVLIPSTDAGYHRTTDDISNPLKLPIVCPLGTYESVSGSTPCKIWPSMTKSSSINCIACSSDSFVLWLLSAMLIGNGEFWFDGLISFSIIVLIAYSVWFGIIFVIKYPIETLNGAYFTYDTSLRITKFSSALQLLAIIKLNEETPIFDMIDMQKFAMTQLFTDRIHL
ncbi:unnamed protein product [Rotaria magnacalcarata]|uniref:Transmembrane protein n=4 Tax=Rotaria magnacalcarata TaxID=392030 RepID=A0A819FMY9_9BILA|nr:unnamed protein product [Rotaria magnacalcarata]